MSVVFNRSGDVVFFQGEQFHITDILMVNPHYPHAGELVHYYDTSRHYISDGHVQRGLPVPCSGIDDLAHRLAELRMCRSQRENDARYFENLRNERRQPCPSDQGNNSRTMPSEG